MEKTLSETFASGAGNGGGGSRTTAPGATFGRGRSAISVPTRPTFSKKQKAYRAGLDAPARKKHTAVVLAKQQKAARDQIASVRSVRAEGRASRATAKAAAAKKAARAARRVPVKVAPAKTARKRVGRA